jgi:uncharacterized protein HemY
LVSSNSSYESKEIKKTIACQKSYQDHTPSVPQTFKHKYKTTIVKFAKRLYQRSSSVVYMIIDFYLKLVDVLPEAMCLVFTLGPALFDIVT